MKKTLSLLVSFIICCGSLTAFSGCGSGKAPPAEHTEAAQMDTGALDEPARRAEFHDAVFHEAAAESYENLHIDFSSVENGYVGVKAVNDNRLKFQIIHLEEKYTYDLPGDGSVQIFPLNMGSGEYAFRLMENITENKYTCIWEDTREIALSDEFQPFLRPSQLVHYGESSECVKAAAELAKGKKDDIEVVSAVYEYLVENIVYDFEKAETVKSGYIPDPDSTLETKTGICFDYASLAAAMMRSQDIPCKLITGYVKDEVYHAWNSIYTQTQGWITVEISVSSEEWKRVDITFAASGVDAESLLDDTLYTVRFTY